MTTSTRKQTNVRLPESLKERLENSAEQSGRSFAAEVVARLEASFVALKARDRPDDSETDL
jgi:predicted DNA-binding protein